MRKRFFDEDVRDIHQKIVGMGATFTDMEESPERLFTETATRWWTARRRRCMRLIA